MISQSKAFCQHSKALDWAIVVKCSNLSYASQIVTKGVELDMVSFRVKDFPFVCQVGKIFDFISTNYGFWTTNDKIEPHDG